jgi:hypothetical protein
MVDMNYLTPSQEFSLDTEIEALVAKIAAGTATDGERAKLAQFSARRARMMRRVLPKNVLRHAVA